MLEAVHFGPFIEFKFLQFFRKRPSSVWLMKNIHILELLNDSVHTDKKMFCIVGKFNSSNC